MANKVIVQRRAERDIIATYEYIVGRGAPQGARNWYLGIKRAIESLAAMPSRSNVAPESEKLGIELRELLHGKRSSAHRIIFLVDEIRQEVHVLTVRHAARRELEPEDLT